MAEEPKTQAGPAQQKKQPKMKLHTNSRVGTYSTPSYQALNCSVLLMESHCPPTHTWQSSLRSTYLQSRCLPCDRRTPPSKPTRTRLRDPVTRHAAAAPRLMSDRRFLWRLPSCREDRGPLDGEREPFHSRIWQHCCRRGNRVGRGHSRAVRRNWRGQE